MIRWLALRLAVYAGVPLAVVLVIVLAALIASRTVKSDPKEHPPEHQAIHEQWYSTWMRPDEPDKSCCSNYDCYPTEVRFRNGEWYAKRREDGLWLLVPAAKIERNRDNPDGRNHFCAQRPGIQDLVFCLSLGSGT